MKKAFVKQVGDLWRRREDNEKDDGEEKENVMMMMMRVSRMWRKTRKTMSNNRAS